MLRLVKNCQTTLSINDDDDDDEQLQFAAINYMDNLSGSVSISSSSLACVEMVKSRPMNKPNLVSAYKLTGKTVAQAAWQLEHQRRRRSLPFGLVMKQFFTIGLLLLLLPLLLHSLLKLFTKRDHC
ncbi:hypothetical protein T4D_14552 [Trichinella pseudospiralis]|uniref:Uncharacterized protein n=1 Tax=Trichinella pseudospiralis TaxID=6337 RepID=A0A0V1F7R7_TRIPS|nr:hypothetical protein T4D_14552 [Trichinella pseudospiralis]